MNRRSKLICPVCKDYGGTITLRRAGRKDWRRQSRRKHWYIGHYDPSKSSRKRWCYLKSWEWPSLAGVKIDHTSYEEYLILVKSFGKLAHQHFEYDFEKSRRANGLKPRHNIEKYDDSEFQRMQQKLKQMLQSMGWPSKWIAVKLSHDVEVLPHDKNNDLPRYW